MAEKVLEKIGGTSGHGTFEIVDVDGVVEIRLNGSVIASVTQGAAVASLTDNSGGTPSGTIAVIADGPTANAVASLAAKLNAVLVELRSAGVIAT